MKKRLRDKLKQMAALGVILGCLLCAFYLSMEEIPSLSENERPLETAGYISGTECELRMEDAREITSSQSRTACLKQSFVKQKSIGSSRIHPVACICTPTLIRKALTYRMRSVKTVFRSQEFLINYIHDQDGEK